MMKCRSYSERTIVNKYCKKNKQYEQYEQRREERRTGRE